MNDSKTKHFYFKFGRGNCEFKDWLISDDKKLTITLSIYFGGWSFEDYLSYKDKDLFFLRSGEGKYKEGFKSSISRNQISSFCSIHKSANKFYFWIFFKSEIYCFSPLKNQIFTGGEEPQSNKNSWREGKASIKKNIECKLIRKFLKIELPEVFSNINSNQKYNRKTIAVLENVENEIAERLVDDKEINIDMTDTSQVLKYMSPMEFETLCFLIFNSKGSWASSYRGGTLKNYDIRVSIGDDFFDKEISSGKYWIQVKKKNLNNKEIEKLKLEERMYLFYLGDNAASQRVLGKKWISKAIETTGLTDWVKKSVFDYDIYNLTE